MTDLASIFATCLAASIEPEPRRPRAPKGAVAGPLWSKPVPVPQSSILQVLRYAKDERFVYEGNWATLIGLRATDNSLIATVSSDVMGRKVTASLAVELKEGMERQVLSGEWARAYTSRLLTAEVRTYPTQLLPKLKATSYGALVEIKAGIRRRRWWLGRLFSGEWQQIEVMGFRLTPEYGELVTSSGTLDFAAPRLMWAKPAAIEVEGKL